ncbi:hypothetical protein Vafri_17101 [Volvox africanus]|uniref:Uncharacterized protein n=1 Tax=Volvox africanus TaxID=51714 RepID=A0A8J4F732_9CHLO|nr:hypothetical protein Vafri_17101 [Volvox africanus]
MGSSSSSNSAQSAASAATKRALRGSQRRLLALLAAALVLAACIAAAPRRMGQPPSSGGDGNPAVPPECMDAGLDLQSKCGDDFNSGLTAMGIDPAKVSNDPSSVKIDLKKLQEVLDKADPPSAKCCDATAKFNNQYCSCSPAVLDLVLSFTNDDMNQYRVVSKYFEKGCKQIGKPYTLYLEGTCPAKSTRK